MQAQLDWSVEKFNVTLNVDDCDAAVLLDFCSWLVYLR
jgi:hypothetical protein